MRIGGAFLLLAVMAFLAVIAARMYRRQCESDAVRFLQEWFRDAEDGFILRGAEAPYRILRVSRVASILLGAEESEQLGHRERSLMAGLYRNGSLSELLETVDGLVSEWTSGLCAVLLFNPETQTLYLAGKTRLPEPFASAVDGIPAVGRNGTLGTSAFPGEAVFFSDITEDPHWVSCRQAALESGLKDCWAYPVFSETGAVLGTIAVFHRESRAPSPFEPPILERLADLVGWAPDLGRHRESEEQRLFRALQAAAERESEQHYKSLFLYHPGAVFYFDKEGRFLDGNRAAEYVIGYSIEELRHQSFCLLLAEPDLSWTWDHFKKAAVGIPQTYEVRMTHKNGNLIQLSVTSIPHVVQDEIIGVFSVCQDITAKARMREELRFARHELEETLNCYEGQIFKIVRVEETFVCTMCGGAWFRPYGLTRDGLVGKEFSLFPELRDRIEWAWRTGEKEVFDTEIYGSPVTVALSPNLRMGRTTKLNLFILGRSSGGNWEPFDRPGKTDLDSLTKREREIAELIALEKSNREIAECLGISENTAKNHIANIFAKLNVDDRVRLAEAVRKEGCFMP